VALGLVFFQAQQRNSLPLAVAVAAVAVKVLAAVVVAQAGLTVQEGFQILTMAVQAVLKVAVAALSPLAVFAARVAISMVLLVAHGRGLIHQEQQGLMV
jgi:hypothetical protein